LFDSTLAIDVPMWEDRAAEVSYFVSGLRALRRHEAFREAPLRTSIRLASWGVHCALHLPATVRLGDSARLRLPPQLKRAGSTGVYLLRERIEPEFSWVKRVLRPGMVFLDGGANLGVYTVLAGALAGDEGLVLAFEPSVANFRLLEGNIALNGLGNTRAYRAALSNETGKARFYHLHGATRQSLGGQGEFELVATWRLDDLLAQEPVERLDFIKLDLEGAEELAVRGALETIKRYRPIVMYEQSAKASSRLGLERQGVWKLLKPLDYRLHLLEEGQLVPADEPRYGNNVLLPANSS
jgi:FkbM family methyltransferase